MRWFLPLLVILALPAHALRVMPMGDSITRGFHGPEELRGSYRYEMSLLNSEIDFVGSFDTDEGLAFDGQHQSVAGYTLVQMIVSYESAVATLQPDVVLVLAGTNDHTREPDANFEFLYRVLLDMIRRGAPEAKVIFATVPRFGYDRSPPSTSWTTEYVDLRNDVIFPAMNDAIAKVASEDPLVSWVDYYAAFDPAEDLHTDAVHPIRSGQKKLADLFYEELMRIPGDTDGDGDIDDADLATAFANYIGPAGYSRNAAQGDLDLDGDIDDADLGTLFASYTGSLGPATVPEPALYLPMAVWLAWRRPERLRALDTCCAGVR